MAAFYILPAAYERRYVQIAMAIIPFYRIQDNFLFHQTGDAPHDQVLHTASIIALILIAATTIVITLTYVRIRLSKDASSRPERSGVEKPALSLSKGPPHFFTEDTNSTAGILLPSLAILTIAITLLQTPLTKFIWTHAPELAFLQFPWRFMAILAAVLALVIALALTPLKLKPITTTILTLAVAAALTYPAYQIFHQPCDPDDTIKARVALFHSNQGTDPTDEYTPTTADNDALAHTNPPWWLAQDPNAAAPPNSQPGPAPRHLSFKATQRGFLILNLRDYPSWNITSRDSNGLSLFHPKHIQREDGLVALPVYYAADYKIDITYTQTLDQILGDIVSLASCALLLILLIRARTKKSTQSSVLIRENP
jgi:hypothetical protein